MLFQLLQNPLIFLLLFFLIDFILGDPNYSLHPVRLIGNTLSFYEKWLWKFKLNGKFGGILLFLLLGITVVGTVEGIFLLLKNLHWSLAGLWHLFIAYSMFALRDLCKHAQRIATATNQEDLSKARFHTSMMVGRDTEKMDLSACNRAGIESLSENLTDGVIAPLFYFVLFGIPGMMLFKVISTMDSMVGYKNEKYLHFGWCGAKLDDVLNYLPARITWLLITLWAFLFPTYSAKKALVVGWKQHNLLPSPNSGWSEAAAAGALQIRLLGKIWKRGKLSIDQWMGDSNDPEGAKSQDIQRMIYIVIGTTILFILFAYLIFFQFQFYFHLLPLV
ncbi:MAG: adenosylcobinamide-phosphate synthase [bacterium]|jgi:adenosylcobinamide-phosphate synthase